MKKTVALICAIAMVFCFCGCRDSKTEITSTVEYVEGEDTTNEATNQTTNEKTSDNGSTKSSSSKKVANPLSVNLNGATITVYTVNDSIFAPDTSVSKTNKKQAQVISELESKMNCKVVCKTVSADQLATSALTAISSGNEFANIVQAKIGGVSQFVSNGLLQDLSSISTLDLSKDYMNYGNGVNASKMGNGTWFVASSQNISGLTPVVGFNKRVLKEIGYSENYIYELVEKNQWTFDNYRKLAKEGTKEIDGKSGITAEDRWGASVIDPQSFASLSVIEAFGATMIKNNNGKLAYNMEDAKVVNAINYVGDMFVKDNTTFYQGDDNSNIKQFGSGLALFFTCGINHITMLDNMSDDFGVVPFPKASSSSKYATAVNHNCTVLMIPKGLSKQKTEESGAFLQALCSLEPKVTDTMISEYSKRYFRDDESGKYLKTAISAQNITTSSAIAEANEALLTGTHRVVWGVWGGKSANSSIQSSKNACVKAIEDLNKKLSK